MIFSAIRAWSERRQVMREIAEHRKIERERDEMRFEEILERAEAAMAADQHAAALRLWHEIRDRFYRQSSESGRLFKIVLDLHQYDDAEQLMNDGLARHPREKFFIIGTAKVAEERGDFETALLRLAVVHSKFPWLAVGYARAAACLGKLGRLDDAEAMLASGIKQAPEDIFCLIEHATVAEARGNFEEALTRWTRLRDLPTDQHLYYQNGTIGLVRCLRTMGRLDEAEPLLRAYIDRFGVQESTLMELASIAEARRDWPEALARWRNLKGKFPMMAEGYRGVIRVLKSSGCDEEVDAILWELVERFPDQLGFILDYAQSAYERGISAEIARRWELVRLRFPDCETAYRNSADALAALGQEDAAAVIRAEHEARFAV